MASPSIRSTRTLRVGVVALLCALTPGCRVAQVGTRCGADRLGRDAGSVLVCRGGRWQRATTFAALSAWWAAAVAANQPLPEPSGPVEVVHMTVGNGSRILPTTFYSPPGPGPFPLVAFAHGYNSNPAQYDRLLRGWAAAGFAVVAPESPGLAKGQPHLGSGLIHQPSDLSAVISAAIGTGRIDPTRIVLAGHSDGGSTVAAMALTSSFRDPRAIGFIVLSGEPGAFPSPYGPANGGPMLVMVGDRDEYGNWPGTRRVFDRAAAPRAFVSIHGGRHIDPFVTTGRQPSAVRIAIIDFLHGVFEDLGWQALSRDANRDGLALTSVGLPGDRLPPPPTTTTEPPDTTTTVTTSTTTPEQDPTTSTLPAP